MSREVYDFLDSELDCLAKRFISYLDNFLTRSQLVRMVDEYDIGYEVHKYQQWLEDNNYESSEIDDLEVAIIAKEFKKAVIKKFYE